MSFLPHTALWYQPSMFSAPAQGWGLQRARYSELCHVNASAKVVVVVKGIGGMCRERCMSI